MELIGRSHQSPFVGHTRELELLRGVLLETEQDMRQRLIRERRSPGIPLDTQRRPQCVILTGEAGIGKTRLAEELGREAQSRGWTVVWSHIYAQEKGNPYHLWTEILRKVLNIGNAQMPTLFSSAQETRSIQPLVALLPELDTMLPKAVGANSAVHFIPEQEQLRLWEAIRDLLIAMSEHMPLLLVLDDIHWADASSCDLLGYLARQLYGYPIVLIGTCRENELPVRPPHPLRTLIAHMQRERAVMTLSVEPLTVEEIGLLVSGRSNVSEAMLQHIQTRAAGNPFFAEELARSNLQTLPKTIEAALDQRMGKLSASCRQLLGKAAVLGGSFEFSLIYALEVESTSKDEDAVLDLLEEALQSGVLTEEGIGARITYHFWHPLLVSYLYERVSERARSHLQVAEILLRQHRGREEEIAATITHHLVQGSGEAGQIAHYAELAGNRAYAFSSYPDAEKFYRITLEYSGYSEGKSFAGIPSEEQLRFAYLLECLGECMRIQGKYEEARHVYEQALAVYKQRTLLKSSEAYQQEAQIQALLCCEIGLTWYNAGKNEQARQCYQRGEDVLRDANIVSGPAWAYLLSQQSYVSWREGMYEEARKIALEALQLFEEGLKQQKHAMENKPYDLTRLGRILVGDPVNLGRTYVLLGLIANGAGQCQEALAYLNMGLTLYKQYASQREIAIVCCNLGDVHLRMAEHHLAQDYFRCSLDIAQRIGEMPLVSINFANLGVLNIRCGNLEQAEDELRKGFMLAERDNDPINLSILYAYLATALQKQGKLTYAGVALRRALAIGRAMRIAPCTGLALVTLGSMRITQAVSIGMEERDNVSVSKEMIRNLKLAKKTLQHALALDGLEAETRTEGRLMLAQTLLLLGDKEAALSLAMQTLEEAERFELTWLLASTQRLLGDIFAAQGKYEQAEQYFEQAMNTFRKSGMQWEYARTLYSYGNALMARGDVGGSERQRALEYLQEACRIFTECKAVLDAQIVERRVAQC